MGKRIHTFVGSLFCPYLFDVQISSNLHQTLWLLKVPILPGILEVGEEMLLLAEQFKLLLLFLYLHLIINVLLWFLKPVLCTLRQLQLTLTMAHWRVRAWK